jgi:transcriptional regulator with XRE-family HTH domain
MTTIAFAYTANLMARGRKKGELTEKQVEQGRRFAEARPSSLTLQFVADQLGKHRTTISRYESGMHIPEAAVLEAMCKLYKKRPEELGLRIVGDQVVRTTVEVARPESGPDILQDALLGRRTDIPLWPSVSDGVWEMITGDGAYRELSIPSSLTQGYPCIGLEVGETDETLSRTAAPGEVIVVGLRDNVPASLWVAAASGNQVAVRGKSALGTLEPIQERSGLVALNPDLWKPIGIILGVVKDISTGRLHVDFEVGGFRYR